MGPRAVRQSECPSEGTQRGLPNRSGDRGPYPGGLGRAASPPARSAAGRQAGRGGRRWTASPAGSASAAGQERVRERASKAFRKIVGKLCKTAKKTTKILVWGINTLLLGEPGKFSQI